MIQQEGAASDAAIMTYGGETTTPSSTNVSHKALPRAAELLYSTSEQQKLYWDRSHYDSPESQMRALEKSSTLYVGNLAFSTRSYHVLSHFSQIGPTQQIIMGLDRFHHTPCGFCFVEYVDRDDALCAVANLNATKLDGRIIRVELDAGFQPGRQYGRGASGGQVRDEKRQNLDAGRQHKRHKPLNWTPPEHVLQQQQQQQQQNEDSQQQQVGSLTTEAPTGDEGQQQLDASGPDEGQETNPRFREE
jgi:nuclear cap-binding protein subunit 2